MNKNIYLFMGAWVVLTLVVGAVTFAGIYYALGQTGGGFSPMSAAPTEQTPIPPTRTPMPTRAAVQPSQTPEPTDVPVEKPPTPTPTLLPVEDQSFGYAIQVQPSWDIADYWMEVAANQIGFEWVKIQIRWEDFEPNKGEINFAMTDVMLPAAAEKGLKVLLSVVTTPEWARPQGANLEMHGPPASNADYVNFVTALVQKYPGMIHAIEVWNEQNLDREWESPNGLRAVDYVALLKDTYEAVKALDPGIIIISGALSPGGGWTEPDGTVTALDDFAYFDAMIDANFLQYADCVGAHHNGYNIGPNVDWDAVPADLDITYRGPIDNPHHSWSFKSTLQTYYQKVSAAGGNQKLCVTEFGWAVMEDLDGQPRGGFEFANDNTLAEQAEWTVEAFQLMKEWDIVWIATLWNLNYGPQAGFDASNDNVPYSIMGPDDSGNAVPRPVWGAVHDYLATVIQ